MALTDTDRRRTVIAAVATVVALPALWWANTTDDSAAPNVAVAGIDVDGAPTQATGVSESWEHLEPVFLDGPSAQTGGGQQPIAVPAPPTQEAITARATFRDGFIGVGTCMVPGMAGGTRVTMVNADTNRSITCTTVGVPAGIVEVVLDTVTFAELADLTDAPIVVEIRR